MPGKGARAWSYFEPGSEVSGLRVVDLLKPCDKKHETVYRVILLCCESEREMTHVAIEKRVRRGNRECAGCTRRRLARQMGEGNRGESPAMRRAAKQARERTVVIESGSWAGRYALLSPMGHRLGYRGADYSIVRGGEQ